MGLFGLELDDFQGLLWLLAFDLGLALFASVALDRRRPAGLREYLFPTVHQILAIEPVLEPLCVDHPFCEQIRAPGHFQPYTGRGAVERGQARLGGLLGGGLVRVDMPIGMHRRKAVRGVVVVQIHHRQFAGGFVLVLGAHSLVGRAIVQPKAVAADVRFVDGHDAQCLAAGRDTALTRHDYQLAVRDLGRAVVLPGHGSDDGGQAISLPATTTGGL